MTIWSDLFNNFVCQDQVYPSRPNTRRIRGMLRTVDIVVENYFQGDERTTLKILCRSAIPWTDIAVILKKGKSETYRQIKYVTDIIREYILYFEKKTYKELRTRIMDIFDPQEFMVLHLFSVYRTTQDTANAMGYSSRRTWHVLEGIDKKLKKAAIYDNAVRDLFITWRRVRKIRKSSYYSTQRKKFKKEFL